MRLEAFKNSFQHVLSRKNLLVNYEWQRIKSETTATCRPFDPSRLQKCSETQLKQLKPKPKKTYSHLLLQRSPGPQRLGSFRFGGHDFPKKDLRNQQAMQLEVTETSKTSSRPHFPLFHVFLSTLQLHSSRAHFLDVQRNPPGVVVPEGRVCLGLQQHKCLTLRL